MPLAVLQWYDTNAFIVINGIKALLLVNATQERRWLQNTYHITVSLVCLVGLAWVISELSHYFAAVVMMLGLVLLMAYLLLLPVNVIHRVMYNGLLQVLPQKTPAWFDRRSLPKTTRALSILLVYLTFILTVILTVLYILPVTMRELAGFTGQVPVYVEEFEDWLSDQPMVQDYLGQHQPLPLKMAPEPAAINGASEPPLVAKDELVLVQSNPKQAIEIEVKKALEKVQSWSEKWLTQTLSSILSVLGSALGALVYVLTGMVVLFYLLLEGKNLKESFLDLLPEDVKMDWAFFLNSFHELMFAFVKGQVILGIATGIIMIFIYSWFNVPYAFLLGAYFGVADIIPVVGTWIGFIPGILVIAFTDPSQLPWVMLTVYIYQTIKDNMVAPKVIGDTVGLHPIIIILSLLICGQVGGLLGVIYSIPLASMLNVLIRWSHQKSHANAAGTVTLS
jgi:predicted PurR-regulated permease PerM